MKQPEKVWWGGQPAAQVTETLHNKNYVVQV